MCTRQRLNTIMQQKVEFLMQIAGLSEHTVLNFFTTMHRVLVLSKLQIVDGLSFIAAQLHQIMLKKHQSRFCSTLLALQYLATAQ